MNSRVVRASVVLLLTAAVAACGKSSTSPSDTSSSDSNNSVSTSSVTGSVATPKILQPSNGAQVRNADRPLLLVVQNAVVTKTGATTYTFEVSTDSAFSTKVQTKDNVAEGTGGQTGSRSTCCPPRRITIGTRVRRAPAQPACSDRRRNLRLVRLCR